MSDKCSPHSRPCQVLHVKYCEIQALSLYKEQLAKRPNLSAALEQPGGKDVSLTPDHRLKNVPKQPIKLRNAEKSKATMQFNSPNSW